MTNSDWEYIERLVRENRYEEAINELISFRVIVSEEMVRINRRIGEYRRQSDLLKS